MISIIIPTRNEEKVIHGTLSRLWDGLASVPHELIVSDGSSTDKTREIAGQFAKVIEETGGRHTIAWGRNKGAEAARGKYIIFLDADVTIPQPELFCEHIIQLFEMDPQLGALTGKIRVLPEMATLMDRLAFGWVNLLFRFSTNFLKVGMAAGEFQAIRADLFRELGGYREDLVASEDLDLFKRVSRKMKVRFVPELVIFHTGRRAHAVGWGKLLFTWFWNWLNYTVRGKAADKEWKPIR